MFRLGGKRNHPIKSLGQKSQGITARAERLGEKAYHNVEKIGTTAGTIEKVADKVNSANLTPEDKKAIKQTKKITTINIDIPRLKSKIYSLSIISFTYGFALGKMIKVMI